MSRSILVRGVQSLALSVGVVGAVGEASDRYDARRQVTYVTHHLRERRRRLRSPQGSDPSESTPSDQQQQQEKQEEEETAAVATSHGPSAWLQREPPKFPYILSMSPGDNPAIVTQAVLGSSDHIIGSSRESTETTLEALEMPVTATGRLLRVIATRWRTFKTHLHGDVPTAFHPQSHPVQRQLDQLAKALQASTDSINSSDIEEGLMATTELRGTDAFVFFLRDFDTWDEATRDQYLQWAHAVTSTGLTHIVLPTIQTVTPSLISTWQEGLLKAANVEFVAILLRTATNALDASDTRQKLRVLSHKYELQLRGLDGDDDEQNQQEEELDASVVVTEASLIQDKVGNWWCDLESVCQRLHAKRLCDLDNEDERLALIQQVCDQAEQETVELLLQSFGMEEAAENHGDEASNSSSSDDRRISALQAWKCLQVVTGVGGTGDATSSSILLSPQELLLPKDTKNSNPKNCVHAVEALMPFNQRVHGETKFMELMNHNVLFLRPKSAVEIGVIPCDPKTLVGPCWVEARPLVKRAFEKLWRDDAQYHRMLALERFEDNYKMAQEIALFDQEIQEKRKILEASRREFLLLQSVMKQSDVARRKAELALLELEIQSKQVYLERLRELLD